ncbi:glucokinase [Linnemannia zychae]|nr:glucokinase [Linnemannia zychae]
MSPNSALVQKRSNKLSKKFLIGVVAAVAVATLVTPVAAGFGCPDSQACANYCFSIHRNGGYCGGLFWHTCYCNQMVGVVYDVPNGDDAHPVIFPHMLTSITHVAVATQDAMQTDSSQGLVVKTHPRSSRHAIARSDIVYESERQQLAVAKLVQDFTITATQLKEIKDCFKTEMVKGLAKQGKTLAMVQTYILGRLTGSETGRYLTLDIGGTNLRVVFVELSKGSQINTRQKKYAIDPQLKVGEPKELFVLANSAIIPKEIQLDLGFTFSFPVLQTGVKSGTLIDWTKGYSCPGMVGKDPAEFLQQALLKRNLKVNVYVSQFGDEKQASMKEMVINIEFGAFDCERVILPMTMFDNKVDRKSLNPSKQLFEKMIAGMYLGEITRNILLDLIDNRLLFRGQSSKKMNTPWEFLTEYMSMIEEDSTDDLENVRRVLEDSLELGQAEYEEPNVKTDSVQSEGIATAVTKYPQEVGTTLLDRQIVKLLVELVGQRSARLASAALGGILEHTMGYTWARADAEREEGVDIGVDGSLYGFYPSYETDLIKGLEDLFGLDPKMSFLVDDNGRLKGQVRLGRCLDGSSVGAALGALLATRSAH